MAAVSWSDSDSPLDIKRILLYEENWRRKQLGMPPVDERLYLCDELLPKAVNVIFDTGSASIPMLQRRLKIGSRRAWRILDEMEDFGIVGPYCGERKSRDILIDKQQWLDILPACLQE